MAPFGETRKLRVNPGIFVRKVFFRRPHQTKYTSMGKGRTYPSLAVADLKRHERQFIQFLALQGIEAPQWETLKKEDPEKVANIIADFSQGIWEHRLAELKYLIVVAKESFTCFRFEDSYAMAVGLKGNVDFETLIDADAEAAKRWLEQNANKLAIFKSKKDVSADRNAMLFEYLKEGARIADNRWFDLLTGLVKK